jgi:hypothetical protein
LVVYIDLISIDNNIRSKIIKDIEAELTPVYDNDNSQNFFRLNYDKNIENVENDYHGNQNDANGIILNIDEGQLTNIKNKIKNLFISQAIEEYIVTEEQSSDNRLAILKRNEAELSGILHCRHCGMEFDDQIQLGNHLRMHYFI